MSTGGGASHTREGTGAKTKVRHGAKKERLRAATDRNGFSPESIDYERQHVVM